MEILLLPFAFFFGNRANKKHLKSINERESRLFPKIRINNFKHVVNPQQISQSEMVCGAAVIATDYSRIFRAGLRTFFGGEIKALRPLMDRARREAVLKMLEQAEKLNANEVWNIRYATSVITSGSVECIAYGTAVKRQQAQDPLAE